VQKKVQMQDFSSLKTGASLTVNSSVTACPW